jgi:hypothetical protein
MNKNIFVEGIEYKGISKYNGSRPLQSGERLVLVWMANDYLTFVLESDFAIGEVERFLADTEPQQPYRIQLCAVLAEKVEGS